MVELVANDASEISDAVELVLSELGEVLGQLLRKQGPPVAADHRSGTVFEVSNDRMCGLFNLQAIGSVPDEQQPLVRRPKERVGEYLSGGGAVLGTVGEHTRDKIRRNWIVSNATELRGGLSTKIRLAFERQAKWVLAFAEDVVEKTAERPDVDFE